MTTEQNAVEYCLKQNLKPDMVFGSLLIKAFTAGAESERAKCEQEWSDQIKLLAITRKQLDL